MKYLKYFEAAEYFGINGNQLEHLRRTEEIQVMKKKGRYYYDVDSYNKFSENSKNLIFGTSEYQLEYIRSYMSEYKLTVDYEIQTDLSNDDGFDEMLLLVKNRKIGNIYAVDHRVFIKTSNFADFERMDTMFRIMGIRVFFVENFQNKVENKEVKVKMDDESAVAFFETNPLALGRKTPKLVEKYKDFYDYVYSRFDDLTGNERLCEIIYRIQNKIEKAPVCPICGAKLKYVKAERKYPVACHICKMTKEGKKVIAQLKYDKHDWKPIYTDEEALRIYKEHKQFYHKTEAFIK